MPFNFDSFFSRQELSGFSGVFKENLNNRFKNKSHGHLTDWLSLIDQLPKAHASHIDLSTDTIEIGRATDITEKSKALLFQLLKEMMPWRKGPFNLFGTHIDTEWRSDWKWQRISPFIKHLQGKRILDVGCGSGYHGWRMLGDGAHYVLGIDPTMRFKIQHMICQNYIQSNQFDFLPIGIEEIPEKMCFFDTTFSMGILYHRRDPKKHIQELRDTLKHGGQLILETLIMDEDFKGLNEGIFVPEDRYAQMRNVWNIPTITFLEASLKELGFSNVKCIEENTTSLEEQRRTEWMDRYSLKEFLDPNDISKTIEGYPAPKRATVIGTKI